MLLTETINQSISAIQRRRSAQENKQSAEAYIKALKNLQQTCSDLHTTLDIASAIHSNRISEQPIIPRDIQTALLDSANSCGMGVHEGTLNLDMVKLLQTQSQSLVSQMQVVWAAESKRYAESTMDYLSVIGNLTNNPRHAQDLYNQISQYITGKPTLTSIKKLINDTAEAKHITEAFALNPTIEAFLKKVSNKQATVLDLTPDVLQWLTEKELTTRLKIRF